MKVDNKRISVRTRKWIVEWLTYMAYVFKKRIEFALKIDHNRLFILLSVTKLSIKNTRYTFKLPE